MKIAVLKERRPGETRVAATPETVKKYIALGCSVTVESGAGAEANLSDDAFAAAGALIARSAAAALKDADVVLKLRAPLAEGRGADELSAMKKGAVLAALLDPARDRETLGRLAKAGVTAFAMDLMPRITRAQSADVLSSQSNLAGYKAVIDAAAAYGRAMPMMMTAAGTIPPAKVLILGAGVAGLQAVATARRLGAVVSAFDVRPAAKEQVESLGASFVEVDAAESADAETSGGYAKEMSADYQRKQAALIRDTLAKMDMAISTALIPGKPAPLLITGDMVEGMKPGSVIVDLAVEAGGNCALSQPGKVVNEHGVTIMGHLNVPGRLAADASMLYARNLLAFLTPLIGEGGKLAIDWSDEIVQSTCLTRGGRIVHGDFAAPAKATRPKRTQAKAAGSKTGNTKTTAAKSQAAPKRKTAAAKKAAAPKKKPAAGKPSTKAGSRRAAAPKGRS